MTRQRPSLRAPRAPEDVRRFPAYVLAPLSADHRDRLRTSCGITLFDRPSEDALLFTS